MKQKDTLIIGDIIVSTALKFESNYREKSPIVAQIEKGNKWLKEGEIICCHHNHFYPPSPYYLMQDLYSIPFDKSIFGVFKEKGKINPMCGNMICERVEIPTFLPVPIEQRKTYIDRAVIINPGTQPYEKGQLIFHKPNAGYDIVYNYNGMEIRVTKVHSNFVVGFVK